MKRMASPDAIRHLPPAYPRRERTGLRFEDHQALTCLVEFAVMLACVVILLALIGTGPW